MTDKPDTSSEAVERLARGIADAVARWAAGERPTMSIPARPDRDLDLLAVGAAATLCALLAEKDAALAQVAASEAKLVTMIEARGVRTSPALPPAPSDTRGWSGMAEGTHMGGTAPATLRDLEQRVAALEQRMRNR